MKDLEEWCKMEIQAEVAVEKQCLKQEHQLEIQDIKALYEGMDLDKDSKQLERVTSEGEEEMMVQEYEEQIVALQNEIKEMTRMLEMYLKSRSIIQIQFHPIVTQVFNP